MAVMMYVRFPLSSRNVEDLLHQRGIDVCHQAIGLWWNRCGPAHLDERFVKIDGQRYSLWQAVDLVIVEI
jgi:putative transposase